MMRVILSWGVLGHATMSNWSIIIIEVVFTLFIMSLLFLFFLSYRKRTSTILKHLEAIEKETRKIEDAQVNNTVSLSDIHGIVSSIDEKQPFHEPHHNN
jgi:hypothetical protein